MSNYGSDQRNPTHGTGVIKDNSDTKGKGQGKGDQAGWYQVKLHHTQTNIPDDQCGWFPAQNQGAAHQKIGQFLPMAKGSVVRVAFDDQHQMQGNITGAHGSSGKGKGGGTVDGATDVDRDTNSAPQYARGDVRQPTSFGWPEADEEYRTDSHTGHKDHDTFRKDKIPNGKRMTAAYGDKTLSADQGYNSGET